MPTVELFKLNDPFVVIDIKNADTTFLLDRFISYSYSYNKKKRDSATFSFFDEDRAISNGTYLSINDVWVVRWGWQSSLLSPIVYLVLKKWSTNFDISIPLINCELVVTKGKAKLDEVGKYKEGKNWGKLNSSDIAKRIAKKYGLKSDVDDSDDKEDIDYYQPVGISDYAYLQFLADEINFEFKIDGNRLYYKQTSFTTSLKHKFVYLPDEDDVGNTLISFNPEVKVIPKNTKTTGSDSKGVDGKITSLGKLNKAQLEELNETLKITNAAEAQANLFVEQRTNKLLASQYVLAKNFSEKGLLSPDTLQSAFNAVDATSDLSYARTQEQQIKTGSLELLELLQEGIYNSNVKKPNEDAKDCKPKNDTSPNKTEEKKAYLELGLDDERSENLVTPVEDIIPSVSSEKKRKKIACAKNTAKIEKAVKANLETLGLPFLKDRDNISILGVGTKFSGIWHITECTHTLSTSYTTTIELKKGSIKSKKSKDKKKTNTSSDVAVKEEYVLELGLNDARSEVIKKK